MTKQILVGGVAVGGGAPVTIQSMCNTRTDDVAATVAQIRRLGPGQPWVRVHQNQLVTQVPQHQMMGQSTTNLSNTENGYFLRGHVSLSSIY